MLGLIALTDSFIQVAIVKTPAASVGPKTICNGQLGLSNNALRDMERSTTKIIKSVVHCGNIPWVKLQNTLKYPIGVLLVDLWFVVLISNMDLTSNIAV